MAIGHFSTEAVDLPVYSFETLPGVLHPVLEPSTQGEQGPLGMSPEEAFKLITGLGHLFCEDKLKELGAVQPGVGKAPQRH